MNLEGIDRHLGRDSEGNVRAAYVTPDRVDPSLLVAIPRSENRVQYEIDSSDFRGYDRWNCYEFSTLLSNGFPVYGGVEIRYPSDSHCIVESKSLKLYLNSYNMVRIKTPGPNTLRRECETAIQTHLEEAGIAPVEVRVNLDVFSDTRPARGLFKHKFEHLEASLIRRGELIGFNSVESPHTLLKTLRVVGGGIRRFVCGIRSNCKVTNQPDWGRLYVAIDPESKTGIDPISLIQFAAGLRGENHFHEEVCEIIYKRLFDLLEPAGLLVACNYMRRGGIDINPVRASSTGFLERETVDPSIIRIEPDLRQ